MSTPERRADVCSPKKRMLNPYQMQPGREMDQLVHEWVMDQSDSNCPCYSTDESAARRVLARIKSLSDRTVIVGRTSIRNKRWFARYETDPSDGTEVLAESMPLAVCRLALLRVAKQRETERQIPSGEGA